VVWWVKSSCSYSYSTSTYLSMLSKTSLYILIATLQSKKSGRSSCSSSNNISRVGGMENFEEDKEKLVAGIN
jgi:hypothetical protein